MDRARVGWGAIAVTICLLSGPAETRGELQDSPAFDAQVLQGGFRFANPDDPERQDAGVLSLGPLVVGGVRHRTVVSGGDADTCAEAVFVLLGARGTKRSAASVTLRQSRHTVVFFVLSRCIDDAEEVCVEGASEAVAVAGCSGSLNLSTRRGIVGKAKVRCKRGIDSADPAFGLFPGERARLAQAFPDLARKVQLRFTDKAGRETTDDDLNFKIRNLDVHALEDIVGTYLADDELPACTP